MSWWHQCPQENLNLENIIKNDVVSPPTTSGITLGKKCFRNKIIASVVEGGIKVAEPDNLVANNSLR